MRPEKCIALVGVRNRNRQRDEEAMPARTPAHDVVSESSAPNAGESDHDDGEDVASVPAPSQVHLKAEPAAGEKHTKTREQKRSRRKRAVRARTICVKRLSRLELALGKLLNPDVPVDRPKTRADCEHGERPCPFVSCTHHLYLDVLARTGAIKLNFPDLDVWEMTESCSLDVADRGGATLEDVGAILNLTRERIRQVEVTALAKLEALNEMVGMRDHVGGGTVGKRRLPILASDEEEEDEDEDEDEWTE
jgi:Sigma-70, region 4